MKLRHLLCTLAVLLFSTISQKAIASHFRGGTLTYEPISNYEVKLKLNTSWRWSAYGNPVVGTVINIGTLDFGDASSANISATVTFVNSAEDWLSCEFIVNHTYINNGTYTPNFTSCCRVSNLGFGNNDQSFVLSTIVTITGSTINTPPTTSFPAILNMQTNQPAATYQLPALDVDGDALQFRFATTAECGLVNVNNGGLMTLSSSGLLTFNTTGLPANNVYSTVIVVEDLDGSNNVKSRVLADLFVKVISGSTPPQFVSPSPASGTVFVVTPGSPISVNIQANDSDAGNTVSLLFSGTPAGMSFTPSLPITAANPVNAQLNWTPSAANVGTYNITVTAQDNTGSQAFNSFAIVVSSAPTFNTPPTPGNNSYYCNVTPGQAFNAPYTISATDSDPLQHVTLSATPITTYTEDPLAPSSTNGVAVNSTLPSFITSAIAGQSSTSNTTTASISGSFGASEWGVYQVEYSATNNNNKTSSVVHHYVVNNAPVVSSSPSDFTMAANIITTVTITATDADLIFGDKINFTGESDLGDELPAFATLNDNLNGTCTITFNPTGAHLGTHNVHITAYDRTTFYNDYHCGHGHAEFHVNVVNGVAFNQATNQYYATIQAAINAANAGDTIRLISNVTENLTINKNIVIKGNGSDLHIPDLLTINTGMQLTWIENTLFINSGASIANNGTIKNDATISGTSFTNQGTYKGKGAFTGSFINQGILKPGN